MSDIVVPDSIEPFLGYKSLKVRSLWRPQKIRSELTLFSPQVGMPWPHGRRAVATCNHQHRWAWRAIRGIPKTPEEIEYAFSHAPHMLPFLKQEPPSVSPPEGYVWSWEPVDHEVVFDACGCGIYSVSHPLRVVPYYHSECVIAQVASWGRITIAIHGARAEYVYPQKIVAWNTDDDVAEKVAAAYGIPLGRNEYEDFTRKYEALKSRHASTPTPGLWRPHNLASATQATQAVTASFPPVQPSRSTASRDLAEVGVWALTMLLGVFGLNSFLGRPAGMVWWLACLAGWAVWLKHRNKKRKGNT